MHGYRPVAPRGAANMIFTFVHVDVNDTVQVCVRLRVAAEVYCLPWRRREECQRFFGGAGEPVCACGLSIRGDGKRLLPRV